MFVIILLAALLRVLSAGSPCLLSHRQSRGLLDTTSNSTCAQAIANGFVAQYNTTLVDASADLSVLEQALAEMVEQYLRFDPRCMTNNSSQPMNMTWIRYPSWVHGLMDVWLVDMETDPTLLGNFGNIQSVSTYLPPPEELTDAVTVRDFATTHSNVTVVVSDLSGYSTRDLVEQKSLGDYTENVCIDRTNPEGPVHPRAFLLPFYRADVLTALYDSGEVASAALPSDWEGLIGLLREYDSAVRRRHNTNATLPPYGLCITMNPLSGRAGDVLAAIAASVLQTNTTQQGYVYDLSLPPSTASPLVNGTAWRYALELLRQLLQYNAPDGNVDAGQVGGAYSHWFASGDCVITLEWDVAFPTMVGSTGPLSESGALLVAPLFGSQKVMDPNATSSSSSSWSLSSSNSGDSSSSGSAGGQLLQCGSTPGLCAVSANHDVLYLTAAGQLPAAAAAAEAARLNGTACGPKQAARMEEAAAAAAAAARSDSNLAAQVAAAGLVNRAPYSVVLDYASRINYEKFAEANLGQEMSVIQRYLSSRLSNERTVRQRALDALRRAAAAAIAAAAVANGDVAPSAEPNFLKATHFSATPWWTGIGGDGRAIPAQLLQYNASGVADPAAVKSYFQALWHGVNSPNLAPDIPSATTINWYKWALSHAALVLQQADVDAAAALLLRLFLLVNEALTPNAVRMAYEAAIAAPKGRSGGGAADVVPPPGPEDSGAGLSGGLLAAVVAGSVTGAALPGLLALLLWRRLRERHRNLLGRVTAPRAGPDTTLLISDIQNSTALWEQLPVDVMDLALKLHHSTFRRLLARYDGYESGTEGDSFILAFADPATAVAFASACQVELLLQEWPHELLQQPDAEVVLVDPRDGEAAQHATLAGDVRRIALRANSGAVVRSSLLAALKGHFRGNCTVASSLRGTPVSPQPSESQLPPLLPPPLSPGLPYPGPTYDPAADMSMYGGSVIGRRRSMDLGLPCRGPLVSLSGGLAAALAGGSGGAPLTRRSVSGDTDTSITKHFAVRAASSGNVGNPRGNASLGATLSGNCEVGPARSGSVSGAPSVGGLGGLGGKLFATRGERGGGGVGGSGALTLSQPLPTLQEGPSAPWVMQWSGALQAAFPRVPSHDTPTAVLGGMSLRVPLVWLPNGRLSLVAFRGLRVRMGLHAGLDDPQHIAFNKVDSSFKYQGPFAETARCTIDAAPGGMVVLSGRAFARLRHCISAAAAERAPRVRRSPEAIVLYAGHHILKKAPPSSHGVTAAAVAAAAAATVAAAAMEAAAASPPSSSGGGSGDGGGGRVGGGGGTVVRFDVDACESKCVAACTESDTEADGTALYQAVPSALVCRLALCGNLVSKKVVQFSSLEAPIGCITVAFMYVVGAATLRAELPDPAKRALEQFQSLVCRLLGSRGGYLVEGGDGLVLAAFASPSVAVEWALDCVAGLKKLAWDPELLSHWLCEEVLSVGLARSGAMSHRGGPVSEGSERKLSVGGDGDSFTNIGNAESCDDPTEVDGAEGGGGGGNASRGARRGLGRALSRMPSMARLGAVATTQRVLERGLRIKVGLDTGSAAHTLNEASGRLSYRGKVMNRASRVAGKAAAGQVLCTDACWRGCLEGAAISVGSVGGGSSGAGGEEGDEDGSGRGGGADDEAGACSECEMAIGGLLGISLGKVILKGVSTPVELIQCMRG